MAGNPEQKKKMMITLIAVVAILGAGVMLAYYYDLFPSSGQKQSNAVPDIGSLPPAMQEEAKKAEEVRQAEQKNPKKKSAGS